MILSRKQWINFYLKAITEPGVKLEVYSHSVVSAPLAEMVRTKVDWLGAKCSFTSTAKPVSPLMYSESLVNSPGQFLSSSLGKEMYSILWKSEHRIYCASQPSIHWISPKCSDLQCNRQESVVLLKSNLHSLNSQQSLTKKQASLQAWLKGKQFVIEGKRSKSFTSQISYITFYYIFTVGLCVTILSSLK